MKLPKKVNVLDASAPPSSSSLTRCSSQRHASARQVSLITFEGIDGSGKSTVARLAAELLRLDGYHVILTKEPGGTAFGREIRAMLQAPDLALNSISEYLLFAADRAHHVKTVILPALQSTDREQQTIILCDRMADSSVAYQACGRGNDRSMIDAVNSWALQGVRPHATCYMVLDYAIAQERIARRAAKQTGHELSSYDRQQSDFFQRVIAGYESLYAGRSDVWRIDASQPLDTCVRQVYQYISAFIKASHE